MLDGVQIPRMRTGNLRGEGVAHCLVEGLFAISCTKMAELTGMSFGIWTQWV